MSAQNEVPSSSPPTAATAPSGAVARLDPARRRLLRGGLAGAPALLALKSTPVLAANCKLPSGFSVSGNLSRTKSTKCAVRSSIPSEWSSRVTNGKYNGTTIATSAQFNTLAVGGVKFKTSTSFPSKTMLNCLALGNTNLQAMCCAAYLDSLIPQTQFPSSQVVLDMWNLGVIGTTGYPVPNTTVKWYAADVQNYLLYLSGQA